MQWKKTKITINRWDADGYRITESEDCRPFSLQRLDDMDSEPLAFSTLDQAKLHAEALNELALTKAENARLRQQIADQAGLWPRADEMAPEPNHDETTPYESWIAQEVDSCDPFEDVDDGRGIPTGPVLHQLTA